MRDDEHNEYHIADVIFKNGSKSYVIELQHSAIKFYLSEFYSLKKFLAFPYPEADFYKLLRDAGKRQCDNSNSKPQ